MYWKEIAWLLSWPLLIWINYLLVRLVIGLYEKKYPSIAENDVVEK